jgi:radical SAM superfamily enzyme YgiQ (UPF0313 family)
MPAMKVGLVQINMGLTWSNTRRHEGEDPPTYGLLPYSAGLLQAYVERHAAGRYAFLTPLHKRVPIEDGVAALRGADVAGFSTYVWNVRLSLAIARRLKEVQPRTLIVFGGPQVPDRAEGFLREHRFVDVAVHGEGEAVFAGLLDAAEEPDFGDVPGVSFLRSDGTFQMRSKPARMADIDRIPSPYIEDTFRALMDANPRERWVLIWETNRGCPFSCTFCDWGSATASKVRRFALERLHEEIRWMERRQIGFVFCADANFGVLRRDLELAQAVVAAKGRSGFPFSLSVQNTKNATDRAYQIQKLLNDEMNAYGVTLSLQSVNPQTLANIKRANISSESFRELQRRFAADGTYTYTDIILGLPGEGYAEFADGVSQVIADGQHNHVQFHNCSLLPNAEMAQPEYRARFGLRTVEQVIRNVHDPADYSQAVEEYLETVVGSDAMSPSDWVRAKVFTWLADLCYFDRTLQIPFAMLAARHAIGLRELIETLEAADEARAPVLARTVATLRTHARGIQEGGPEYFAAPRWGNLLWPGDQYALISLVLGERLEAFYVEVTAALCALLESRGLGHDEISLREAIELNRAMLRLPDERGELHVALSHDILEHHAALLCGRPRALEERLSLYTIGRDAAWLPSDDAWLEHIAWCQGKDKRAYLYDARPIARRAETVHT